MLLGGGCAAHFWPKDTPKKVAATEKTAISKTTPNQGSAKSEPTTSAESEQTQKSTSPPPKTASEKIEILVNIPRSTFRIGEDSGTITVSNTASSSVGWVVTPQYPSTIYLTNQSSFVGSTTSFLIKTNTPPSATPGIYTVTIDAYKLNTRTRIATKVINFTILPQKAFDMTFVSTGLMFGGSDSACGLYQITSLANGVELWDIEIVSTLVSGDPTGVDWGITPPEDYPACLNVYIDPSTLTPGTRTFRLTASYNGYIETDDFTVYLPTQY